MIKNETKLSMLMTLMPQSLPIKGHTGPVRNLYPQRQVINI